MNRGLFHLYADIQQKKDKGKCIFANLFALFNPEYLNLGFIFYV